MSQLVCINMNSHWCFTDCDKSMISLHVFGSKRSLTYQISICTNPHMQDKNFQNICNWMQLLLRFINISELNLIPQTSWSWVHVHKPTFNNISVKLLYVGLVLLKDETEVPVKKDNNWPALSHKLNVALSILYMYTSPQEEDEITKWR